MRVAVIGYGYWGKNLTRVFSQSKNFELACICEVDEGKLSSAKKLYANVKLVRQLNEIPEDVGAVAIATPTSSHFELAHHFLTKNVHVLVSKPFTKNLRETHTLMELAEKNSLVAFCDYTFVFNSAVKKFKEILPKIGNPFFVVAQRLNLGLYQPDVNVIHDLLPHDLSILLYLFESKVQSVQAFASKVAGLPQEDLAHCNITLESGMRALVTVSWLSPFKIRQFIAVGSQGMLSYDDTAVAEKVKFYDHGLHLKDLTSADSLSSYTSRISYRSGDLFSPAISPAEALATELDEFHRCISDKNKRAFYHQFNMNVMQGLEMTFDSLNQVMKDKISG